MQPEQRTQEWFDARVGMVTGSRVGAILGYNKYQTPAKVMDEMLLEARGERKDLSDIPAIKWGVENEAQAIRELEFILDGEVKECPFIQFGTRMGSSPDGVIGNRAVEIKCPYGICEDTSPQFKTLAELRHYWAQCQWHMQALDLDECVFFQWTPYGSHMEIVERDQEWFDLIQDQIAEFTSEFDKNLTGDWHEVEYMIKTLMDEKAEIEAALEDWKSKLPENFRGALFTRTKVIRTGAVDYRRIVEERLPEIDVEPYRKESTTTLVLRAIKEKSE